MANSLLGGFMRSPRRNLVVEEGSPPFSVALAQGGYDATTSSAIAVAANDTRSQVTVVNTSDEWVYLGLGAAAAVGAGIALAPAGGSWTEAFSGEIRAIHGGTGTKRLTFLEL